MELAVDPPPADPALVDEAVALARAAGALTLRWFGARDLAVEAKADASPVTAADRAAEAHVRAQLADSHPDDGVLGEEEPERLGTSGRRWIVDPIDGTKAFVRSVPLYTTLLAVEDEHGIAVGVIHAPALDRTVWAGRGLGCVDDATTCRVSTTTTLDEATVTTSSWEHWPESALLGVKRAGAAMKGWGDGYGYLLVATGAVDAMVDPAAAPYDLGPVPVVIAEAGGTFSDWTGAVRIDGGTGIATNGPIHDELRAALTS
ncbi:MAG: hypothetical protein H0V33_06455 [Acidimicrobiia bacterium]|jgi:histidinol-phosphatase|nr:hypothetical protein [Acidimicrobiia bacterium]